MNKRLVGFVLLSTILSCIFAPATYSEETTPRWNEEYSFYEEIIIPINTSGPQAKYQPIDIPIEFSNPCWGKNENEHSIRVICWDEKTLQPLESQIYDIEINNGFIQSCNLVFLIPEYANGKEKYFIYYDDEEKNPPEYEDHVDVEESLFTYDKIPTIPIEEQYFKITEEGYIIYDVVKDGVFINPVSQQVTKLKPNVKDVTMKNRDHLASFDLNYWYYVNGWNSITTIWKYISSKIIVDGNLMVKFGIVSRSKDDIFQTSVMYKYYYTPHEDKRLYVHVKHELLSYPVPTSDYIDLTYAMLKSGGIKSSTLRELNFGEILPYLHFYGENEKIEEFDIPYPENNNILISKDDDVNIGSRAWISVDEGECGKAHALIFASNNFIKNGTGENDGIEIEMDATRLSSVPGFDGRFIEIYLLRNASKNHQLPKNLVVEFDAEYFTTENGGLKTVEKEVDMYQSLIKYHPANNGDLDGDIEGEKYTLRVDVYLAPTFPLGSTLSVLTGKSFPYISVEVYDIDKLLSTEACERLHIIKIPVYDKLIDLIKQLPDIFDYKNFSLLKYVKFEDLKPDKYLIKVWWENSIFFDKRQYIGYQIVDLKGNQNTQVICSPEGRVELKISDQNNNRVENVQAYLMKDNFKISEGCCNSKGNLYLSAPCGLNENYKLNVIYKGFLVYDEIIHLGYTSTINPLFKEVNLNLYDFFVDVKDGQGNAPEFDIKMILTSDEMKDEFDIPIDNVSNGRYSFLNLYPATYTLTLDYNSFEIEEIVKIPKKESLEIDLHNLELQVNDNWDLPPGIKLDMILSTNDFKKSVVMLGEDLSNGKYQFSNLYEGNYKIKYTYKSFSLEKQISIPYEFDEMLNLNFDAEFDLTLDIYDSHGNLIPDVNVKIIRDEKEKEKSTNNYGNVTFEIPPGKYHIKIYSGDRLIAERNIDQSGKNYISITSIQEPWYPYIITGLLILIIIGAAYINYMKKDTKTFLKILAIAIALMAVVLPWWIIYGSSSSPKIETSTNLYLTPLEMVTITSTTNIISGELTTLEKTFELVIGFLPILIVLGCIGIIFSMILNHLDKKIFSKLLLLGGLLVLISCLLIFSIGMSQLAEIGVGSFIGSGDIEINIPGEGIYEILSCSWGPAIGFYLLLISVIILFILTFLSYKGCLLDKFKKIYIRKI